MKRRPQMTVRTPKTHVMDKLITVKGSKCVKPCKTVDAAGWIIL